MKTSTLYKFTYIYLALPLIIFLASWLDYGWAFLFALVFGVSFYKIYPALEEANDEIATTKDLALIIGIAFLWCFLAGIGYFYYQSFDYHFRNAVFRDLIHYDWPVFYDKPDTPLVYYMGFWLIPAIIAKFFSLFITNQHTVFIIGNIFLLIYAVLGVVLIFVHLLKAVGTQQNFKLVFATVLLFILFSGLDILGYMFFKTTEQPFEYHLEWWSMPVQISSITTNLFWVFNQFIPIALITFLVYNERNIKNFGFLISIALFFSPYPCFGIGVFMIAYALKKFVLAQNKWAFCKYNIFSLQNIIGVFVLLPLIVLYYITNSDGINGFWNIFDTSTPFLILIFMLLEFLFLSCIIFSYYRYNVFFITAIISLITIPFIRIDLQNNFCLRATIPAIIILATLTIHFMIENFRQKTKFADISLILIFLLIGSITPFMEFYRGVHYTTKAHNIALVQDGIYTLNQRQVIIPRFYFTVNHQFSAKDYRTDIFWQYIAKKH